MIARTRRASRRGAAMTSLNLAAAAATVTTAQSGELRSAARRGLRTVALSGAAMVLVVLALSQSDLTGQAVADLRARARPEGLVAALALMCGGMIFLALRWRALMPDRRGVGVVQLAGLLVVGTLLNYAFPGPVGEFAAAAMAGRRFRMPAEIAFAAGTSARFVGLAMAGVVAALFPVQRSPRS